MIKKKSLISNVIFYFTMLVVSLSIYRYDGLNSNPKVLITNILITSVALKF